MSSTLEERIEDHLRRIGAIGRDAHGGGWTRLAFTHEEDDVHTYAKETLESLGFRTSTDAFQNLIATLKGTPDGEGSSPVLLGTHLDTVRSGGNYDGVVGFIVALEAVRECMLSKRPLPEICVSVFRAEESTLFKKACLGSRAAFLGLDDETLGLFYETSAGVTVTLAQAVGNAGGTPSLLNQPLWEAARFRAYFETHIEQARILEQKLGLDGQNNDSVGPIVGIVTSIRAPHRCEWEVSGPGAFMLLARCIIAVESCAILANRLGLDAVATVGRVDGGFVGADKVNAIPGLIEFPVRHANADSIMLAQQIARNRKCQVYLSTDSGQRHLRVVGVTDHSGGTPMGLEHRRDALVAACEIVVNLSQNELLPCPRAVFTTDVRSNGLVARDFVSSLISSTFDCIERSTDIRSSPMPSHRIEKIRRTERSEPLEALNGELQDLIASVAEQEGIRFERLASGAGHDAMMAATAGVPTAMMFIPSIAGLSHNPQESSRIKDIAAAVRVQAHLLRTFTT